MSDTQIVPDDLGPLESQVFAIFRKAWADSGLDPKAQPDSFTIVTAMMQIVGQIESAVRLLAARLDRESLPDA